VRTLTGFRMSIRNLIFSPDGRILVSVHERILLASPAPDEYEVQLWDVETGKALRKLQGDVAFLSSLVFSPDGRILVGNGRYLRRWDVATGKALLTPEDSLAGIYHLAVSLDGRAVTTGDLNNGVRTWQLSTGRLMRTIENVPSAQYVAHSPDGRTMAWCNYRGEKVILSDSATGKERWRAAGRFAAFSASGRMVAITSNDEQAAATGVSGALVAIRDVTTGELRCRLEGLHMQEVSLAFSPNDQVLASTSRAPPVGPLAQVNAYSGVRLWDVHTGKEIRLFGEGAPGGGLLFSPDGRTLAAWGRMYEDLSLWEVATGRERGRIPGAKSLSWREAAFTPDGKMLVVTGPHGVIQLWDWPALRKRCQLRGHDDSVHALAFNRDSTRLISGSADTTALVWDLSRFGHPEAGKAERLTAKRMHTLWRHLASDDADTARQAIGQMLDAGSRAVPFLNEHLRPAVLDRQRVSGWIAALDSDSFAQREEGTRRLAEVAELAEPVLRRALKSRPSLEARRRLERLLNQCQPGPLSGERARDVRAIELLECLGTPEARALLERLAAGASGARLTQEAKASLDRQARLPDR
jgi:WD40 repeat protein